MGIIAHAWRKSFSSFGGTGFVWSLVAIPIVGLALRFLIAGKAAMSAEFQVWLIYGLAAAGLVFSSVFLWNLACAPLCIEREAHENTKKENKKLKALLSTKKTKRKLNQEQIASLSDAIRDIGVRPETMNVLYTPTSGESADFATDIGDAIKGAGIDCTVHNGTMFDHNPRDRGIKIFHGKSKSIVALAKAIQTRFRELGFHPEKRPDTQNEDKIFLYVARSPEMD